MTGLLDAIASEVAGHDHGHEDAKETAQAIIALIIARIPPLVWMDGGFNHDADFVDTTQTYQIQEGVFWYAAEINGVKCGSNEAAKVAANAHHVAQLLKGMGIE